MKRKKIIKYIVNTILIGTILGLLVCIVIEKIGDNSSNESSYKSGKLTMLYENNTIINEEGINNNVIEEKQYPKEEILDTYKGYEVCAKIEIPTISLKVNILSNYSKKALNVSATKFWGVEPNQNGNFCVAGHNTKSMFSNIKKLNVGDTFFITDKEIGKVEYEIFEIDKVVPEDVNCLDSTNYDEKEVTLITCTNDSKKRVIIKAKEKI